MTRQKRPITCQHLHNEPYQMSKRALWNLQKKANEIREMSPIWIQLATHTSASCVTVLIYILSPVSIYIKSPIKWAKETYGMSKVTYDTTKETCNMSTSCVAVLIYITSRIKWAKETYVMSKETYETTKEICNMSTSDVAVLIYRDGVPIISRLLQNIRLFCRI